MVFLVSELTFFGFQNHITLSTQSGYGHDDPSHPGVHVWGGQVTWKRWNWSSLSKKSGKTPHEWATCQPLTSGCASASSSSSSHCSNMSLSYSKSKSKRCLLNSNNSPQLQLDIPEEVSIWEERTKFRNTETKETPRQVPFLPTWHFLQKLCLKKRDLAPDVICSFYTLGPKFSDFSFYTSSWKYNHFREAAKYYLADFFRSPPLLP